MVLFFIGAVYFMHFFVVFYFIFYFAFLFCIFDTVLKEIGIMCTLPEKDNRLHIITV